ncbi:MAG: hypothetical protein IPG77_08780 [Betaproteobacteria bacterium]|nr:hypothetical protein [Betaproteobacteria bacterium]
MKEPELVTATQEELDEILLRARPALSDQQYRLLEGVLATFVYVMLKLQNAKTSIKRFQRMLFGHRTEHKRNVLERSATASESAVHNDAESAPALPGWCRCRCPGHPSPATGATPRRPTPAPPSSSAITPTWSRATAARSATRAASTTRPPGPSSRWWARRRWAPPSTGFSGCAAGCATPSSPPPLPAAVASLPKYDSSCASMIAVLRYGHGLPNFRLEGLQASLYIPLPDATQWDIVSKPRRHRARCSRS